MNYNKYHHKLVWYPIQPRNLENGDRVQVRSRSNRSIMSDGYMLSYRGGKVNVDVVCATGHEDGYLDHRSYDDTLYTFEKGVIEHTDGAAQVAKSK